MLTFSARSFDWRFVKADHKYYLSNKTDKCQKLSISYISNENLKSTMKNI